MLGFGKKDDDKDEEKIKQLGEQMRALSDKIAEMQQQVNQRDAEIARLKQQIGERDTQINQLKQQAQQAPAAKAGPADSEVQQLQAQNKNLQDTVNQLRQRVAELEQSALESSGGLRAGGYAYVQSAGGKELRLRNGPGLGSQVLDGLAPGTRLLLKAGPQEADGYSWWHIRTDDGKEGWVAGQELNTQPG